MEFIALIRKCMRILLWTLIKGHDAGLDSVFSNRLN